MTRVTHALRLVNKLKANGIIPRDTPVELVRRDHGWRAWNALTKEDLNVHSDVPMADLIEPGLLTADENGRVTVA